MISKHIKTVLRWLLGIAFVAAGINHFWHPDFYLKIMPDYLPWHRELVYLSGVCEMIAGALLLHRQTQSLAAWGIVAMLLVFFMVHIDMLVHAERYPEVSPAFLWGRLLLQFVLIAWAWWYTGPPVSPLSPLRERGWG